MNKDTTRTWPDWVVFPVAFTLGTDPEIRRVQCVYPECFIDDKGDTYSHAQLAALTSGIQAILEPAKPPLSLPEWLIPGAWVYTSYEPDFCPDLAFKVGSVEVGINNDKRGCALHDTEGRGRWCVTAQRDIDAIHRVTISPWNLETLARHCTARTEIRSQAGVKHTIDEVRTYPGGATYAYLSDRTFISAIQLAKTMTLNDLPCGTIVLTDRENKND